MTLPEQLEFYADHVGLSYMDRYEQTAQRFYEKTGILAPGKDQPADGAHSDVVRNIEWAKFQVDEKATYQLALRDAANMLRTHGVLGVVRG